MNPKILGMVSVSSRQHASPGRTMEDTTTRVRRSHLVPGRILQRIDELRSTWRGILPSDWPYGHIQASEQEGLNGSIHGPL